METSSYEYVKAPQLLSLERFAHALRFDRTKSDIALFISNDTSDQRSYILNGIFFPILIISVLIMWLLIFNNLEV